MAKANVDVDGVCANFVKGLELVLNHKFSEEDLKQWDIIKNLPRDLKEEAYDILSGPSFWRNLPVIDGAKDGIDYFEAVGLEINWVTSPWASCESWKDARRGWLNEHFDMEARGHGYYPTSQKHEVDGSFLLDDKPDNIRDWVAAHPKKKAFIFDQPYNRTFNEVPRFTWQKVRSLV